MSRIITFVPAAGGVGNTTLCVNTAGFISRMNNRVLLVDLNMGLRAMDLITGLFDGVKYTLYDVINKRCNLEQAVCVHPELPDLGILNASWTKGIEGISEEEVKELLGPASESYDYILIDIPTIQSDCYKLITGISDQAVIVSGLDKWMIRNTDKTADILRRSGLTDISLIINKYRDDLIRKGIYMSITQADEQLGLKVAGVVPTDDSILTAVNSGKLIRQEDKRIGPRQLKDIAGRLTGMDIPFSEPRKRSWRQLIESNKTY